MAYIQTDLDRLDAAIASGALSVEYGGRKRVFRSVDDLLKARSFVAAQLSGRTNRRIRYSVAEFADD